MSYDVAVNLDHSSRICNFQFEIAPGRGRTGWIPAVGQTALALPPGAEEPENNAQEHHGATDLVERRPG